MDIKCIIKCLSYIYGYYDFIKTNQLPKEKLAVHGLIMTALHELKVMIVSFFHT